MMEHDLKRHPGSKRQRRRVGRGVGSGRGNFSGHGIKGAKSRTGWKTRPGYEGGQLPLIKKLPMMRGFTNIFRTEFAIVNLKALDVFPEGADVTPQKMQEAGLIKNLKKPVKVLAEGDVSKALTIHAHRFSSEARKKIEAARGKVQEL